MWPLTAEQQRLLADYEAIASVVGVDPTPFLEDDSRADWRTTDIQYSITLVVRGYVVTTYSVVDAQLDDFLTRVVLEVDPDEDGQDDDLRWVTRMARARSFKLLLMDNYPIQKFRAFKDIVDPPKYVQEYIYRLNDLRNALAHTLVLRERRAPVRYKKKDIFSSEGFKLFFDDGNDVNEYIGEQVEIWKPRDGFSSS